MMFGPTIVNINTGGSSLPDGEIGQILVLGGDGQPTWIDMPASVDEVPDSGTPGFYLRKTSDGVVWTAIADLQPAITALTGRVTGAKDDISALEGTVNGGVHFDAVPSTYTGSTALVPGTSGDLTINGGAVAILDTADADAVAAAINAAGLWDLVIGGETVTPFEAFVTSGVVGLRTLSPMHGYPLTVDGTEGIVAAVFGAEPVYVPGNPAYVTTSLRDGIDGVGAALGTAVSELTAQINAITDAKDQPDGIVGLDANGFISEAQIPPAVGNRFDAIEEAVTGSPAVEGTYSTLESSADFVAITTDFGSMWINGVFGPFPLRLTDTLVQIRDKINGAESFAGTVLAEIVGARLNLVALVPGGFPLVVTGSTGVVTALFGSAPVYTAGEDAVEATGLVPQVTRMDSYLVPAGVYIESEFVGPVDVGHNGMTPKISDGVTEAQEITLATGDTPADLVAKFRASLVMVPSLPIHVDLVGGKVRITNASGGDVYLWNGVVTGGVAYLDFGDITAAPDREGTLNEKLAVMQAQIDALNAAP